MLGLSGGEFQDTLFARVDKLVDAQVVDGVLRAEAELFFDFDFDPQALTVKTVLIAQFAAVHRPETLVGIFVGAAPGVMDPHRVVGGDGAVEETPRFAAAILVAQFVEDPLVAPKREYGVFARHETGVC